MKTILATLVIGTLFSGLALPVGAHEPGHRGNRNHARYHDDLEHRAYHRELAHREAHRYPMSWRQHERLHDALEHDAYHDRLEHREYHRRYHAYRPYNYYQSHRYGPSYGYGYRQGGLNLQFPSAGFHLRFGR